MKQYFVNYSIGIRAYQAGPYASYDEAEIHEKDIRSYAGIKECFVAEYRNPLRTLIGEEDATLTNGDHKIGKYRADYSPLTPEEIAQPDPDLVELEANSRPVTNGDRQ